MTIVDHSAIGKRILFKDLVCFELTVWKQAVCIVTYLVIVQEYTCDSAAELSQHEIFHQSTFITLNKLTRLYTTMKSYYLTTIINISKTKAP